MTSGKTEQQKKEEERRALEAAKQDAELAQKKQVQPEEEPRTLDLGDKKDFKQEEIDPLKIYKDWVEKYKKSHPEFDEKDNKFTMNSDGKGCLSFKDPQAEEDFVRELAKKCPGGCILDKGIKIAEFKDGELIDLRTKKPFPEGGYADLVSQLDKGVAYDKTTIKSAEDSLRMSPPNRSLPAIGTSLPETPVQPTKKQEGQKEGLEVKEDTTHKI